MCGCADVQMKCEKYENVKITESTIFHISIFLTFHSHIRTFAHLHIKIPLYSPAPLLHSTRSLIVLLIRFAQLIFALLRHWCPAGEQ